MIFKKNNLICSEQEDGTWEVKDSDLLGRLGTIKIVDGPGAVFQPNLYFARVTFDWSELKALAYFVKKINKRNEKWTNEEITPDIYTKGKF